MSIVEEAAKLSVVYFWPFIENNYLDEKFIVYYFFCNSFLSVQSKESHIFLLGDEFFQTTLLDLYSERCKITCFQSFEDVVHDGWANVVSTLF